MPSVSVASVRPSPLPAPPPIVRPATPKVVMRDVVFGAVHPSNHVFVSIDDGSPILVNEGDRVSLDSRGHTLVFTCQTGADGKSPCDPLRKTIDPGERTEAVPAKLTIHPAVLRIEGDPNDTYGVVEYPSVKGRVGDDITLPLSDSAAPLVRVVDQVTGKSVRVQLYAGKSATASFLNEP